MKVFTIFVAVSIIATVILPVNSQIDLLSNEVNALRMLQEANSSASEVVDGNRKSDS